MNYSYEELRKRVRDVWLAKCISGNIGFNQECYKQIFDFKCVDDFAPTVMMPNDDLDIQLAWLDLMLDKGYDFDSADLLDKFIDCYKFDFSEYGYAKRNFKRGILPPYSGSYNNHFKYCMGCPIRVEVWSLVSCGDIELCMSLAQQDGEIDHGSYSVDAEKWIGAMQSIAFNKHDMKEIISESLGYLPKNSLVYETVSLALDGYIKGRPWIDVVKELHKNYGSPDGTYVVINMGIMTAGLLYGGDNFDKVMTYTLNGGYDTDCTCATAGSIFAMAYGLDSVDKKWIDLADKNIVTATENLHHKIDNFDTLADETMRVIIYGIEHGIINNLTITGTEHIERLKPVFERKIAQVKTIYDSNIEVRPGEVRNYSVEITNIDNVEHNYKITAKAPANTELKYSLDEISLKPGKSYTFACQITFNYPKDNLISEKNVVEMTFTDGDKSVTHRTGFVGSPIFRLSPVYFDGFDMKGKENIDILPDDLIRVWGGKKYLYHTDCNEYANNWVRYDHPYISENWTDEYFDSCYKDFELYTTKNDFIRLEEHNSMTGSCVVYALQKLVIDEDEKFELHIGSSDPYKIWINGELVAEQDHNWYFSPYNQRPRVNFKKGVNRIAIKLVRTGEGQKFSFVLRKSPFNHVGAIATDNKYLIK